jgi:hypothetical protein
MLSEEDESVLYHILKEESRGPECRMLDALLPRRCSANSLSKEPGNDSVMSGGLPWLPLLHSDQGVAPQ